MENVIYNELRLRGHNVCAGVIEARERGEDKRQARATHEIDQGTANEQGAVPFPDPPQGIREIPLAAAGLSWIVRKAQEITIIPVISLEIILSY